jgi:hypothetical protein
LSIKDLRRLAEPYFSVPVLGIRAILTLKKSAICDTLSLKGTQMFKRGRNYRQHTRTAGKV